MLAWSLCIAYAIAVKDSETLQPRDELHANVEAEYNFFDLGCKLCKGSRPYNGLLRRNAAGERPSKDVPVLTSDEIGKRIRDFRDLTKMYRDAYKHHRPPAGDPNKRPYSHFALDLAGFAHSIQQDDLARNLELRKNTMKEIQRLRAANVGWEADLVQIALEDWWIAYNTHRDAMMGLVQREDAKRQSAKGRSGSDDSPRSGGSADLFGTHSLGSSPKSTDGLKSGGSADLFYTPRSGGSPKSDDRAKQGGGGGSGLKKGFFISRPS